MCGGCYYNSDNDYFPPAFDTINRLVIEECHLELPAFPHARSCEMFKLANTDPEVLNDDQEKTDCVGHDIGALRNMQSLDAAAADAGEGSRLVQAEPEAGS